MRVQNIFDIAVFESGLMGAAPHALPGIKAEKKNEPIIQPITPDNGFDVYPAHFYGRLRKAFVLTT